MGKLFRTTWDKERIIKILGGYNFSLPSKIHVTFETKKGMFGVTTLVDIGEGITMTLGNNPEEYDAFINACSKEVENKIRALFPERRHQVRKVRTFEEVNDVLQAIEAIIKNE